MSKEQAQAFVKRLSEDEEFRERVEAAETPADKRAILVEEGYGDIKLRHISQALPESMGGELSDEELQAVAGGGSGDWTSITAAASASAATGASVSAIAAAGAALA